MVYCEQLIGPDTVNTMPPATVDAFDDHGVAARTLPDDVSASKKLLADLAKVGIDLKMVCDQLVDEGVKSFAKSFTELLGAVAEETEPARLVEMSAASTGRVQTQTIAGPAAGAAANPFRDGGGVTSSPPIRAPW